MTAALVPPTEATQDSIRASIGISELAPTTDPNQSLREADEAMYRAKAAGRGTAVVYAPTEGSVVDVRHYEHRIAGLQRLAERDGRTGLLRDVVFSEDHLRQLDDARRSGSALSLVLVDLDHFHAFNTHYLYAGGDEALRAVAACVVDAVRDDEVYRFGGEELAVLLPRTDEEEALAAGERIRAAVEGLGIDHIGSSWNVVTVSVGICTHSADPTAPNYAATIQSKPAAVATAMVNGANRALLDAKEAGRNRCRSAPPQADSPPVGRR